MSAPLYENLTSAAQGMGWDLDRMVMMFGQTVRIEVHHDTIYAFQSKATASVWTPAPTGGGQWNVIASVAPMVWAGAKGTEYGATEGLWEAVEELTTRADHLMSVTAEAGR